MNSEKQYIELFQQHREMIDRHSCAVMNAVRGDAFDAFATNGFPDRKVERYKYTDVSSLFAPDYGLNLNRLDIPVNPYDAFRCDVPNLSTLLFFMVNDSFYKSERIEVPGKQIPVVPRLPEGVIVGSLAEEAIKNPDFISKYYGKLAKTGEDAVTALNTMLAQDGLLVYVPKGVKMNRTIQVVNIMRSDVDLMVNRRVLIIVEEGADVKLLLCDHTADDHRFLTTEVVEAFVGNGASLEMYSLEETHYRNVRVSNTYVEQQSDSRMGHDAITLHNGITRNRLDVFLRGEGAECQSGGCVITDKEQHVDNNTLIEHAVSHCTSHQLYKYVLNDKSTGAFAGRVLVDHDAQKTVSEMRNQNLCATHEARMYTQPMLEIYADDVKCSHGSTVGQLNEQALFYMRQRGITLSEALLLLQTAFVNEVVDIIPLEPLRDRLHYLIDKRFRGELNKCEGCKLRK